MAVLLDELDRRWERCFRTLAAGDDLGPGERLRCEGVMEAAVLCGEADAGLLQARMARCYLEVFGISLEETLGDDWREYHPFPELPAWARRAPVSPTTPP